MRFNGLRGGSATNAFARERERDDDAIESRGGLTSSRLVRARLGERDGSRDARRLLMLTVGVSQWRLPFRFRDVLFALLLCVTMLMRDNANHLIWL